MSRTTPTTNTSIVSQGTSIPSPNSRHDPTRRLTLAMAVHARGAPACTSTPKPNMASPMSASPSGVVGSTPSP